MNKKRYLIIVGVVATVALVSILLHQMLANEPPRIVSMGAEPSSVIPSGTCRIVCHATDPDGDDNELSYDWSAGAGSITGIGPEVTWIAPASLGSYNVTVTVTDPRGGEDTKQITIAVRIGNPPVITSLIADAVWATPSGSLQVTCTASDPDGDALSYEWFASGGNISGTGEVADWTAPQEVGIYHVTVMVRDSHGGSATDLLNISVATSEPPNIEALLITKDRYGHCYLKKSGEKYLVGKGPKYDSECVVLDTSEPIYEWSCTGGELSGEGSLITWTAPDAVLDVTVTVVASDSAGNTFSKNMILSVVSCSRCTFGC